MSNHSERNRLRISNRLAKLFGKQASVNWNQRVAYVRCSPGGPMFTVQPYGTRWRVACPDASFQWEGSRLIEGARQLKALFMLIGDRP